MTWRYPNVVDGEERTKSGRSWLEHWGQLWKKHHLLLKQEGGGRLQGKRWSAARCLRWAIARWKYDSLIILAFFWLSNFRQQHDIDVLPRRWDFCHWWDNQGGAVHSLVGTWRRRRRRRGGYPALAMKIWLIWKGLPQLRAAAAVLHK